MPLERQKNMTNKYLISLVIPAYQAESTLAETLDAALDQDFEAMQIVVVDDGSHDETLAIAQRYSSFHLNIKVIHQENRGTGGAYNTGVQNADGEWISICSADDVLYPGALSTMWAAHEAHPEMSIIASNGDYWHEDGKKIPVYSQSFRFAGEVPFVSVLTACFYSVGALYNKNLFTLVGGYNEGIFAEDYDFWLRSMANGARAYYINQILSAHRISPTQKSANIVSAYQSDISIYQSIINSGLLSEEQIIVANNSIKKRLELIEQCLPKRRSAKMVLIDALANLVGRDTLEHIVHTIKGKK